MKINHERLQIRELKIFPVSGDCRKQDMKTLVIFLFLYNEIVVHFNNKRQC